MTFVELKKTNFDNARIKVFPQQHYTSGSSLCLNTNIGESGCVPAIRTRSKSIKEIDNEANLTATKDFYHRNESGRVLNRIISNHGFVYLNGGYSNFGKSQSDNYFFKINRNTIEYRNPESTLDDDGFELSVGNENTSFSRKILVKNSLYNKYKSFSTNIEDYNYGFSNYNTLNFFTLGVHPDYTSDATVEKKTHKTCVIYPNPDATTYTPVSMQGPTGEYNISFWLNPRRTNVNGYDYNIGTILSIPGLINIYLAKGSSLDENSFTDKFRLLVDIEESSFLLPDHGLLNESSAVVSNNTRIITDDNILEKNKWHHISLSIKNKLLKLYIDGVSALENVSGIDNLNNNVKNVSKIIYVGNRHNYANKVDWQNNFNNLYDYYFGSDAAEDFSCYDNGLPKGRSDAIAAFGGSLPQFEDGIDISSSDSLALNAEIADLRIYDSARLSQQVSLDMKSYINSLENELHSGLLFYLPLYFVPEKRSRKCLITYGNKHIANIDGPVNPYLSHRVLGHEVSVEHFLNEFVKKYRPFIEGVHTLESDYQGTGLSGQYETTESSSSKLNKLFITDDTTKNLRQNNIIIRNKLILPNDNGLTLPSWSLIKEVYPESSNFIYSKDIFGNEVKGLVSVSEITDLNKITSPPNADDIILQNFINGSLYRKNRKPDSILEEKENIILEGHINPDTIESEGELEDILSVDGKILVDPNIFNNKDITKTESEADFHSEFRRKLILFEMTSYLGDTYGPIFEIPNAFYSEKIREETIELEDKDISGTAGSLSIKLKDNSRGGIYRADCLTEHAKWNYVGHVFRSEGFINLLHPALDSFGEISYDIKFKGEHGLNVFEINVPCLAGEHNASLNKSFKHIKPTNYFSDINEEFVFIDTINLHDENLNIVAKANLSQPLSKRITDKYNFRLKLDY